MKSAAVYVRISSDPTGEALGVGRQLSDCQRWAESHDSVVAEVYEDNDISAYKGKPRPAYKRMCEDIKEGVRDGIITWHPDRLHRNPREIEDFINLIEAAGTPVHTVTAGDYDLSTAHGRLLARMLGAVACHESDDKSRRGQRKAKELAEQGQRSGGGTRGYGYDLSHRKPIAKEAAIIKEAAKRILSGDSLRSICNDLNERNIATVKGGQWTPTVLKGVLTSYRISGQRSYKDEAVYKAAWPAIVTPNQTARLRSLLLNPARRTNRTPRSYPLSGLVRCDQCGEKMESRPRDDGARRYICPPGKGSPGCGKTYVLAEPVEKLIAEAVIYRLDSPDFARTLSAQSSRGSDVNAIENELGEDRLQLDELAAMYGRKEMSAREWTIAKAPIQQRIGENERRLGKITGTSALDDYAKNPDKLRRQWDTLAPARQRSIVAALVDYIAIGPGVRGRNTFDSDRVRPQWRA